MAESLRQDTSVSNPSRPTKPTALGSCSQSTSGDIYSGPTRPPGKKSNRAQTWPDKGWNAILHPCAPLQPWGDFEEGSVAATGGASPSGQ